MLTLDIRTTVTQNPSDEELKYQALLTFLDYHARDSRSLDFSNANIGHLMGLYVQRTPATKENAHMCYEILRQFESLLNDIYSAVITETAPSPSVIQSKWRPRSMAIFLWSIDLRTLKKWESDVLR